MQKIPLGNSVSNCSLKQCQSNYSLRSHCTKRGWTCPSKIAKTGERGNKKSPRIAWHLFQSHANRDTHLPPEPDVERKRGWGTARRGGTPRDRLKARGDRQLEPCPLGWRAIRTEGAWKQIEPSCCSPWADAARFGSASGSGRELRLAGGALRRFTKM